MPKPLQAVLLALALVGSLGARAGETVIAPFRTATGQLVTLTERNCGSFKVVYSCDSFDPAGPGYQWCPDNTNNCTDAKCKSWLSSSALFCRGQGAPCRGLTEGVVDAKGVDSWKVCFRTCDGEMLLDRKAICLGCKRFETVATNPPVVTTPAPAPPPVDPPAAPEPPETAAGKKPTTQPERRIPDLATCDNEKCLHDAADLQRKAEEEARQRRLEYQRAAREAREQQQSSVTSATELLSSWKKQLDTRPSSVTGEERARYRSDERLVQQARAAISPGEGKAASVTFTGEDALRANDPDIMRQLAMNADFHDQEKSFVDDVKATQLEEQRFHGLVTETLRRAGNLGARGLMTAPVAAPAGNGPDSGVAAATPASAGAVGRGTLSGSSSHGGEDPKSTSQRISPPGSVADRAENRRLAAAAAVSAGQATGSGTSLRDLLRKRLESHPASSAAVKGSDREALDGASFGGEILVPSARGTAPGFAAGGASAAEEVMNSFRAAGAAPPDKRFALGEADTEAEVARLTGAAQSAQTEGGLLAADTQSLFERVRQAHLSCLARSCVAASRR